MPLASAAADILDKVSDTIVVIDRESRYVYANRAAARLAGLTPDAMVGRTAWDLFPRDGTALADACRRVLHDRTRITVEEYYPPLGMVVAADIYPTEEGIAVHSQDHPQLRRAADALRGDDDGFERQLVERTAQLSAALAAQRKLEHELKEVNRRTEVILGSITDSFFGFSHDFRFTFLNSHARAQMVALGKDPDRMIGRVLWDEFEHVPNEAAVRRVMNERVAVTEELYYAPLDRWLENHMYPSPDGGMVTLQKDVTERRLAERKLQRWSNYLDEAERLSHVASWAVNVTTRELFWSAEHFRICGVDPATFHLTVDSARELIHPDDRQRADDVFEAAFREAHEFEWDLRFIRPDGSIRYAHSLGHPVFDSAGVLTEYVGTIIDTTEARRTEQERTLLVRRAMAAQEGERRRLAREMHDQLGERISALSLHVLCLRSHCDDSPEVSGHLDSLEEIARQLDADVGFLVWQLRPTVLDDLGLAAATTANVKSWSRHHGIEAHLRMSGLEKERLSAESETTLYRITQEALTNVAKHARARHVSVILERRSDHVFLMVEDDGVGFAAADRAGVDASTWGLMGMRERAELVGGSLEIESTPGRGVTVVARIPAPAATEAGHA